MGRDPDTEDGDINRRDDHSSDPFDFYHQLSINGDNKNPVDDNLHQQLDFKDPKEQECKQYWNSVRMPNFSNQSRVHVENRSALNRNRAERNRRPGERNFRRKGE